MPSDLVLTPDRLDLTAQPNDPVVTYLARLAPGSRRTMVGALTFIAQEFSKGLCTANSFPWANLRYEHTQLIRTVLAERYAPATANKMLHALRGVMKECWRLGKINVEELHRACDIQPVRGSRVPQGREISVEEENTLLATVVNAKHRTLIRFMLWTGLRRAEVAALAWGDLTLSIPPAGIGSVRVRGKGGKERVVPIPPAVVNTLSLWLHIHGPNQRVFGMTSGTIWSVLRNACFHAGLAPITPHDLRRTYASRMLRVTDLATVQRLMGHASPNTTAGYDRRGVDEAANAVERAYADAIRSPGA